MSGKFEDDLEGLFAAAAADADVGSDGSRKKGPSDPTTQAKKRGVAKADAPGGLPRAAPASASNGSPPAKKSASTIRGATLSAPPPTTGKIPTSAGPPASAPGATPAPAVKPSPSASFVGSKASLPALGRVPGADPAKASSNVAAKPAKPAKPIGREARKNLEMIAYDPEEPLIDHKGRSKPLYKPRTKRRPQTWKPSKPVRLLLGLIPGTRVMALDSVAGGLPYTILGVLTLLPALFAIVGWSRLVAQLRALGIDDRWQLAHAGVVVLLLLLYEFLRLGSFLEERTSGLRAPRILATFAVPSIATAVAAPFLVDAWPRLVEAAWFAALPLGIGSIAGAVWSIFEGSLSSETSRKIFRFGGIAALVALIGVALATGAFERSTLHALAAVARSSGFNTLPEILGDRG